MNSINCLISDPVPDCLTHLLLHDIFLYITEYTMSEWSNNTFAILGIQIDTSTPTKSSDDTSQASTANTGTAERRHPKVWINSSVTNVMLSFRESTHFCITHVLLITHSGINVSNVKRPFCGDLVLKHTRRPTFDFCCFELKLKC